jgi:hypothetical protein
LQLLHLLFMPALILLTLLLDRASVMLERLPRMFVFLLQRLTVLFILVQPLFQADDALFASAVCHGQILEGFASAGVGTLLLR